MGSFAGLTVQVDHRDDGVTSYQVAVGAVGVLPPVTTSDRTGQRSPASAVSEQSM
jgi:hypothetical protein